MSLKTLRVGIVGAGANTRERHIPGLRAIPDLEIVAVCNRRPESTAAVAEEYEIPRQFDDWRMLIADPEIDAVVIGTWPYLHCPITLSALEAGKHVLTEARMSMNAKEAHKMLAASNQHPDLVCQVVPSPFGLKGDRVMRELIEGGHLGELREVHVYDWNASLASEEAPLSWRQDANLSGLNMLTLGILHETLLRWVPPPVRVFAQAHAFIESRTDPQSGSRRPVGTPDHVQVLTLLENGARGVYQFSGAHPFEPHRGIRLIGSRGMVEYDLLNEEIRLWGGEHGTDEPTTQEIPAEKAGVWRVEEEFVEAIRERKPIRLTDFETGVAYMEFTEAVALSADRAEPIELPLFQ